MSLRRGIGPQIAPVLIQPPPGNGCCGFWSMPTCGRGCSRATSGLAAGVGRAWSQRSARVSRPRRVGRPQVSRNSDRWPRRGDLRSQHRAGSETRAQHRCTSREPAIQRSSHFRRRGVAIFRRVGHHLQADGLQPRVQVRPQFAWPLEFALDGIRNGCLVYRLFGCPGVLWFGHVCVLGSHRFTARSGRGGDAHNIPRNPADAGNVCRYNFRSQRGGRSPGGVALLGLPSSGRHGGRPQEAVVIKHLGDGGGRY